MTAAIPHAPRRVRLSEKRKARNANSRRATEQMWNDRIAKADTPVDVFEVYYGLAKTRVTQAIKRADAAVVRASKPGTPRDARDKALARAAKIRHDVTTDIRALIIRMHSLAIRSTAFPSPRSALESEAMWSARIDAAGDSPMQLLTTTKRLLRTRVVQALAAAGGDGEARGAGKAEDSGGVQVQVVTGELSLITADLRMLADKYYKPRA